MDIFDALRPRLLDSLLWRQRLPVRAFAAGTRLNELESAYAALFAQLGEDLLKRLLNERFAREFFGVSQQLETVPKNSEQ